MRELARSKYIGKTIPCLFFLVISLSSVYLLTKFEVLKKWLAFTQNNIAFDIDGFIEIPFSSSF